MKHTSLVLLMCIACASTAFADYFDGNDLIMLMDSERPQDVGMFRGYVAGVQDFDNGVLFCVNQNVKLSQTAAIVQKYFSDIPQTWHLSAKQLVANALQNAFPCKK